jgi:hypothetical protein
MTEKTSKDDVAIQAHIWYYYDNIPTKNMPIIPREFIPIDLAKRQVKIEKIQELRDKVTTNDPEAVVGNLEEGVRAQLLVGFDSVLRQLKKNPETVMLLKSSFSGVEDPIATLDPFMSDVLQQVQEILKS